MDKNYMNYKCEYLNRLERIIDDNFYRIDNALQTCLDDYYEACETSNMLKDTMKLLSAIEEFSSAIKHDNERDDMCMLVDLIVEGMRGREGDYLDKYSDDAVWSQYVLALENNMDLELERKTYELNKFRDDAEVYTRMFDSNWHKNEREKVGG